MLLFIVNAGRYCYCQDIDSITSLLEFMKEKMNERLANKDYSILQPLSVLS